MWIEEGRGGVVGGVVFGLQLVGLTWLGTWTVIGLFWENENGDAQLPFSFSNIPKLEFFFPLGFYLGVSARRH